MKLVWTGASRLQFDKLRQQAAATNKLDEFIKVHNEIVMSLRDIDQAIEKGEPLYHTRKSGGEVRQWVHEFISVSYAVFRDERVAWITKYQPVPASWPN
jgi:hypothetical protein